MCRPRCRTKTRGPGVKSRENFKARRERVVPAQGLPEPRVPSAAGLRPSTITVAAAPALWRLLGPQKALQQKPSGNSGKGQVCCSEGLESARHTPGPRRELSGRESVRRPGALLVWGRRRGAHSLLVNRKHRSWSGDFRQRKRHPNGQLLKSIEISKREEPVWGGGLALRPVLCWPRVYRRQPSL